MTVDAVSTHSPRLFNAVQYVHTYIHCVTDGQVWAVASVYRLSVFLVHTKVCVGHLCLLASPISSRNTRSMISDIRTYIHTM